MYDQLTLSASGQLVIFEEFNCSTSGFTVLQALNRHRDPRTAPISAPSLERSFLYRDGSAPVICKASNASSAWSVRSARWGRDGVSGESRYVQDGFAYVGLLPVTSFCFRVQTDPKTDWFYDRWRATRTDGWCLVALAMNDPNSASRDFAIALTGASSDLQHLLRKEPMTVPVSHWERAAEGHFPARPGSWRVERA